MDQRKHLIEVIGVIFTILAFVAGFSTDIFALRVLAWSISAVAVGVVIWLFLSKEEPTKSLIKLLVVDDTGQILADFHNYLNRYQPGLYDVKTTASAKQTEEVLKDFHPQFAVVDLQLNKPLQPTLGTVSKAKEFIDFELKGLQLIKFLLSKEKLHTIVILSGFAYDEVKDKIENAFVDFPNKDKILQDIEQNYVYKGKGNYILAVLDKLKK